MNAAIRSARHDAVVALILIGLSGWAIYVARQAAVEAERRYGFNTDSGSFTLALAIAYLVPAASLFTASALTQWRGWRVGAYLHWAAFAFTLAPALIFIYVSLTRAL